MCAPRRTAEGGKRDRMGQNVTVTGMVLKWMPAGDYDRRITLLTTERGKITAFARGARRQNSQLLAAASPFSFGEFELFEGRSSYTVAKGSIQNYFRELTADYEATYYGFYFLEFADYCCQENNDEREMLKLLYQSLKALGSPSFDNRLVRVIFELRSMAVNGTGPGVFACARCGSRENPALFSVRHAGVLCAECGKESPAAGTYRLEESALYTMQYILSVPVEKLYTFAVSDSVLSVLMQILKEYLAVYLGHSFQSLKILSDTGDFTG